MLPLLNRSINLLSSIEAIHLYINTRITISPPGIHDRRSHFRIHRDRLHGRLRIRNHHIISPGQPLSREGIDRIYAISVSSLEWLVSGRLYIRQITIPTYYLTRSRPTGLNQLRALSAGGCLIRCYQQPCFAPAHIRSIRVC